MQQTKKNYKNFSPFVTDHLRIRHIERQLTVINVVTNKNKAKKKNEENTLKTWNERPTGRTRKKEIVRFLE